MASSSPSEEKGAVAPDLPSIPFIDLGQQQARIRGAIDTAIARVLDHGQYIMGPEVRQLEAQLAALTGARHVVSCASGTDALLIALMSLGNSVLNS